MSHPPQDPPEDLSSSENSPQDLSSNDLTASGITIPSESEPFSSLSPPSTSPPQSSPDSTTANPAAPHERKVVIYTQPTFWSLLRGAAINLLLPFVNGMMLGLGELLAHEVAFRWGWGTTQIFPKHRASRTVGPGVEMRDDPAERRRREDKRDHHGGNATGLD